MTTAASGRGFFKMSGSGNDFVFFDARDDAPGALDDPRRISALCARGTGVGADGVVFLERPQSDGTAFRIRYYNADGSHGALCGNASLCSARLAVELGAAPPDGFAFGTDAGTLTARFVDGEPEIDLEPVSGVQPATEIPRQAGEHRIGFALAGVPHLVILVDDVERADVTGRGAPLRRHPSLADGANVNFVGRAPDGWAMRTFERGVEGETLACGTGAVATAILLATWGEADPSAPIRLRTRSGRPLTVTLRREGDLWCPSLRGEGRIVFQGALGER
jgi:diaminopimelate epimerase